MSVMIVMYGILLPDKLHVDRKTLTASFLVIQTLGIVASQDAMVSANQGLL